MKPLRIVFAGTPEFGIPCLQAIAQSAHELIAIYTQPDRPSGRGRKLQHSAIKAWGVERNIPIYQPVNFKNHEAIAELESLQPDIIVVIAYGLILPEAVLTIPKIACVNVHASILPRWRGASPIQSAILHGDTQTGVSIMKMDKGMDTGPVYTIATCPILQTDSAESLHNRLGQLSTEPLLHTLDALALGNNNPEIQNDALATYASKINKEDAEINWHQSAKEIHQQIRAFNPWPICFTTLNAVIFRIYEAEIVQKEVKEAPGTVVQADKEGIRVATGNNYLLIKRLQFPGGKVLAVHEWIHANRDRIPVHSHLSGSLNTHE